MAAKAKAKVAAKEPAVKAPSKEEIKAKAISAKFSELKQLAANGYKVRGAQLDELQALILN